MKTHFLAALALAMVPALPAAAAEAAAAAAAPAFSSAGSDIGTLIDNPATKAVLVKYLPDLISNPQIEMARTMTLKQIQGFAADQISDETLAKIDADLAKIPGK